jgi:hypothetical protein
VVNDREGPLDIVTTFGLSCKVLVFVVECVVMVIADSVIVFVGCDFIIKMDFRVNVTANITQLRTVENTVMTIANGSIRFR